MKQVLTRRRFAKLAAGCGAAGALGTSQACTKEGGLVYFNPLAGPADVEGFAPEGDARVSFENGRMRMENARPPEDGQAANFVYWCPEMFPDDIEITWKFWPVREPGLCVMFFAARGLIDSGETHVLDKRLKPRAGLYDQYTNSDVSALQISYFRRQWEEERAFHLANLRRAPGFEMLAQGADPLPDVEDAAPPYEMRIRKSRDGVSFAINDLIVFKWSAPQGASWPSGGSVGFRQMAPLIAEYADLTVRSLTA